MGVISILLLELRIDLRFQEMYSFQIVYMTFPELGEWIAFLFCNLTSKAVCIALALLLLLINAECMCRQMWIPSDKPSLFCTVQKEIRKESLWSYWFSGCS